jgi:hypothetical protein
LASKDGQYFITGSSPILLSIVPDNSSAIVQGEGDNMEINPRIIETEETSSDSQTTQEEDENIDEVGDIETEIPSIIHAIPFP